MIEQLSKLRKSLLFIAVFLLTTLHITATNRDSLALTPPMGFMTWNKYKEDINEQLIRQIADKMAADGYAEAGYKYIFTLMLPNSLVQATLPAMVLRNKMPRPLLNGE